MALRSVLIAQAPDFSSVARASPDAADVVLLDLRTGPPSGDRGLVAAANLIRGVRRARPAPAIWLRLHPLDDPRLSVELSTLCPLGPDALLLGRAETAAAVEHLGALLAVQEAEAGLAEGSLGVVAMIETAGALFELHRVARASARLVALCWDGEALARDLGADEDREVGGRWTDPLQTARTLTLAACADARLPAIDSPFTSVDAAAFRAEAERAARDGFAGKLASGADQVATLNAAFEPRG